MFVAKWIIDLGSGINKSWSVSSAIFDESMWNQTVNTFLSNLSLFKAVVVGLDCHRIPALEKAASVFIFDRNEVFHGWGGVGCLRG